LDGDGLDLLAKLLQVSVWVYEECVNICVIRFGKKNRKKKISKSYM